MKTDTLAKRLIVILAYVLVTALARWTVSTLLSQPDNYAVFAGFAVLTVWVLVTILIANHLYNSTLKDVKE